MGAHEINIVTDIENVVEETNEHEQKIVNDVKEKEIKDDSESIEAVRDNEIVEVAVEQKILQKQEDRSPDESDKDEPCIEKEDLESNEKDVEIKDPKEENSKQESVNSERGQGKELNRKDMADPALQICDTTEAVVSPKPEEVKDSAKFESPVTDRKPSLKIEQNLD